MKKIRQISPIAYLVLIFSASFGLINLLNSNNLEAGICIWIMGFLVLGRMFLIENPAQNTTNNKNKYFGILLLFTALGFVFLRWNYTLIVAIAVVVYFNGFKTSAFASGAIFIWIFLCSRIDYFHFVISYPLQIIGANMSGFLLNLCGKTCTVNGAVITMGDSQIAITTACSGIEQLEAMMLLGGVIVMLSRLNLIKSIFYFAAILPIIIVFNLLRLFITLFGSTYYPEFFLGDFMHTSLGILTVIFVGASFYSVGFLFKGAKEIRDV